MYKVLSKVHVHVYYIQMCILYVQYMYQYKRQVPEFIVQSLNDRGETSACLVEQLIASLHLWADHTLQRYGNMFNMNKIKVEL